LPSGKFRAVIGQNDFEIVHELPGIFSAVRIIETFCDSLQNPAHPNPTDLNGAGCVSYTIAFHCQLTTIRDILPEA